MERFPFHKNNFGANSTETVPWEFLENLNLAEFPKCKPFKRKVWEFRKENGTRNSGQKFSKIWVYIESLGMPTFWKKGKCCSFDTGNFQKKLKAPLI